MLNKILLGLMGVVIAAMCLVIFMGFFGEKPQPVAKVSKLRGAATMRTADGMEPLQNGSLVYAAQQITVAKGSMRLEFADGSFVILGDKTRMSVENFDYEPETKSVRGSFQFIRGALRAVTGRQALNRNIAIKDALGTTIGIRGTDVFAGNLEPGKLDVLLIESKRPVTVKNNQGGIALESGQGTTVESGTAPTDPKFWPQAKVDKALAMVRG